MAQRGTTKPLYEARHGTEHCRAGKLCVECGDGLTGRQQRWCGRDCVQAYLVRQGSSDARRAVLARDHGVCAGCGLDTEVIRDLAKAADARARARWLHSTGRTHTGYRMGGLLHRRPRPGSYHAMAKYERLVSMPPGVHAWWWRKTWWDMDHVVAVEDGGGQCGLDNLQTLCLPCHAAKTAQHARQRAKTRRGRRGRVRPRLKRERCPHDPTCVFNSDDLCVACSAYRLRVTS